MAARFQFSIRLLLVATAAVAGAVAAISAEPSWQSLAGLECLTMFFATASVVAMRRTCGKVQTFWIGSAVGFSVAVVCAGHVLPWFVPYQKGVDVAELRDYSAGAAQSLRLVLPAIWCMALVNGILAVLLQWFFFDGIRGQRCN